MTRGERVPASLPVVETMRRHESGREWLTRLPGMIEELCREWELWTGPPFHGGSCSWVAPARRRNDTAGSGPMVLKVTWPHPEATHEATALRMWSGNGAVRVHAHDAERYALLLERCEPGRELGRVEELPAHRRLASACGVLRELWSVPPPPDGTLDQLTRVAGEWADLAEQRAARPWPVGVDQGLFTLGARLLRELPGTADRSVLLHGDFNPGNVLSSRRRPWLAIDAKPMTGDPAFDPWPLIEQVDDPFALPDPHRVLTRRTALVARLLDLDPWRVRAWSVARHVEYLLWSVVEDEDEALSHSVALTRQARILADVAGL